MGNGCKHSRFADTDCAGGLFPRFPRRVGARKNETVSLLPDDARKPLDQMLLRIRVLSSGGDRISINLPLGFVRIASKLNFENFKFNGSDALKAIDIDAIISLIESGVVGKLVEVESGDGDTVEIFVES